MDVPIELCLSARVYKASGMRKTVIFSIIIALYAVTLPFCYNTAGEPRAAAMLHAQKLADEKWALEAVSALDTASNSTLAENLASDRNIRSVGAGNQSHFVPQVDVSMTGEVRSSEMSENELYIEESMKKDIAASQSRGSSKGNIAVSSGTSASGVDTLTEQEQEQKSIEDQLKALTPKAPGFFSGWFGPSKEQKKAKAEFEKWQKKFNERSPTGPVSLPPSYLPSAWACLALFSSMTLHALFYLLCHWILAFKAKALFLHAAKVEEGLSVLVTPPANRGKPLMVVIVKSPTTGLLQIEFQRQLYIYTPSSKLGSSARDFPNGVFSLSACPTDLKLTHYTSSTGINTESEITKTLERWGKNHLAVQTPSFFELLQNQLLSPLAMFQVFCALLWLLDEYWSYTAWSLVSVVVFETTTVFQRTRTQKVLGGMAPPPTPIYVYRLRKWTMVTTKDLLPGDFISLAFKKRSSNPPGANTAAVKKTKGKKNGESKDKDKKGNGVEDKEENEEEEETEVEAASNATSRDELVPCDCLLLRGAAVVNEASLTGESVPQMKEALSLDARETRGEDGHNSALEEPCLDMNGQHRVHTLFSGTSLVTVDGHAACGGLQGVPPPPDQGAVAYVLRTGFSSSQGALLQMIEFSQQTVSGDAWETGLALLILFIFAIIASGYVLKEGLRKKEKTTHEILLKCVIIITSVVPRQFPMQMAMAVNMALMALMKTGIFCTEPYRVPLAGKVSHCLFDKTGTLTTDQLVPVGVINSTDHESSSASSSSAPSPSAVPPLSGVCEASGPTAMVLAACHSLVVVEDDSTAPAPSPSSAAASSASSGPVPAPAPKGPNLVGDPIELAAMKGVEWSWDATSSTAHPGNFQVLEQALTVVRLNIVNFEKTPAESRNQAFLTFLENLNKDASNLESKIRAASLKAASAPYSSVSVAHRHHFSSTLQRMSVVCVCKPQRAAASSSSSSSSSSGAESTSDVEDEWFCLVKGSPEAIKTLLSPTKLPGVPSWYSDCYESLARRGLRVLALAYKKVSASDFNLSRSDIAKKDFSSVRDKPRSWVESDLQFGGFIAFECKIRGDSPMVVRALRESDHKVAMLTGDALLTSLHVAKQVGICDIERRTLTLTGKQAQDVTAINVLQGENENSAKKAEIVGPYWELRHEDGTLEGIPLIADYSAIATLNLKFDLLTTEKDFYAAAEVSGGDASPLWRAAEYIKVFARMSPQGKAAVIRAIQKGSPSESGGSVDDVKKGKHGNTSNLRVLQLRQDRARFNRDNKLGGDAGDAFVLMCGDGGNDVGALKQADVGIALLAGHANANTADVDATSTAPSSSASDTDRAGAVIVPGSEGLSAEDALNARDLEVQKRGAEVNAARMIHMKQWQAEYTKQQQLVMQEELKVRTAKGEYSAMFTIVKEGAMAAKRDTDNENRRFMMVHGQVYDEKKSAEGGTGNIDSLIKSLESSDAGGLPMIRPGDASVAAPFTSRTPSVRAVVDLIRQGRCTLLSALMQQQIMMLESIIAAYTLSALSLHNARSSERQMMASSWLIMTAAISFSYASPLDHMHPLRPLRSLFHPAIFISILGQAIIHIACMTLAVKWATDAMGPVLLKEVAEFFRKAKAKEIDTSTLCPEEDFVCQMNAFWTAPFLPNLLNSTVFLVETSQMIAVFFTNYKGRPWMKGMLENHPLFLSVFVCVGGVIVASWEMAPQLNDMIQLAPFPDDSYRYKVVVLVVSTIFGTFVWDRLCTMMFAPKVFKAMTVEASRTTLNDVKPVFMTLFKVVGGVYVLSTGNLLLMGLAFYFYRRVGSVPPPAPTPAGVTPSAK